MRRGRRARREPSPDERIHETAHLGILSVLLVLVPALVLMAHVTEYAAIHVSPPLWGGDAPHDGVIRCGATPPLEVAIADDGFFTRTEGQRWKRAGAPAAGHDHAALTEAVREHKRVFPHETVARISAEADVPYGTVVATLDTVRGPSCRLAGAFAGEEIPEDCLLWQAVIRDRTPNLDVPAHRGGGDWPPQPPHALEPGGRRQG